MKNVTLSDFHPYNTWTEVTGPELFNNGISKYITDGTGRRYYNQSQDIVSSKCFWLVLGTPFAHPVAAILYVPYRLLKLVTLSHFWIPKDEETTYNFKARLKDAGEDLLRVVASPLAIVGLELAAIYGLFMPFDGRKLYATIERATYGCAILAPCFQPEPTGHLFGGDTEDRNAW